MMRVSGLSWFVLFIVIYTVAATTSEFYYGRYELAQRDEMDTDYCRLNICSGDLLCMCGAVKATETVLSSRMEVFCEVTDDCKLLTDTAECIAPGMDHNPQDHEP